MVVLFLGSCAWGSRRLPPEPSRSGYGPVEAVYGGNGGISFGEPLAVSLDFEGNLFVADGVPGRIVRLAGGGAEALEFEKPFQNPGFYPSDLKMHGFFVYVLDEVNRRLLRFDKEGGYRDILINFNEKMGGRRASPVGLDVEHSGRIAVSDIENHRILLFDVYLELELAFGSYGAYPGQLDSPEGIAFTQIGHLLVADSGNGRVSLFDGGGTFIKLIPEQGEENPLKRPRRAVEGQRGNIYVADPVAGGVFVFDPSGVFIRSYRPDGERDFQPTDVEASRSGFLYVTDAATSSLYVFRVMPY